VVAVDWAVGGRPFGRPPTNTVRVGFTDSETALLNGLHEEDHQVFLAGSAGLSDEVALIIGSASAFGFGMVPHTPSEDPSPLKGFQAAFSFSNLPFLAREAEPLCRRADSP